MPSAASIRKFARFFGLVVCVVLGPVWADAQTIRPSVTGVVTDSSGAVLPGVTVEVTSPALIEKARTAVTDGSGSYRIIELETGIYTVTFTLSGFSPVKREGLELSGSLMATVNAELRVGTRGRDHHRLRRKPDCRCPELAADAGDQQGSPDRHAHRAYGHQHRVDPGACHERRPLRVRRGGHDRA